MRGEFKLTNLLLGLLLVGLSIGVFTNLLAAGSEEYGTEFDEDQYATFNQLEAVRNNTQAIQERSENVGADDGFLDILGGLFQDAYQAMTLSKNNIGTLNTMIDGGTETLPLGENAVLYKTAATAAVIIIIIIGIILAIIFKRDL